MNARNELTVRAAIVDGQKHPLNAGASLPKDLWLIAYCGSEAPAPNRSDPRVDLPTVLPLRRAGLTHTLPMSRHITVVTEIRT